MEGDTYQVQHHSPSRPVVQVVHTVDLEAVAKKLERRFRRRLPHGYRGGKRRMEKALSRSLRIGPSRAAYLIDRLEDEGKLVYARSRSGGQKRWRLRATEP